MIEAYRNLAEPLRDKRVTAKAKAGYRYERCETFRHDDVQGHRGLRSKERKPLFHVLNGGFTYGNIVLRPVAVFQKFLRPFIFKYAPWRIGFQGPHPDASVLNQRFNGTGQRGVICAQ